MKKVVDYKGQDFFGENPTEKIYLNTTVEDSETVLDFIESFPTAVVGINKAHEMVLFNSKFETVFGYREKELRGRSLDEFISSALADPTTTGVEENLKSSLPEGRTEKKNELRALKKNGITTQVQTSVHYSMTKLGEIALISLTEMNHLELDVAFRAANEKNNLSFEDDQPETLANDNLLKTEAGYLLELGTWDWDFESSTLKWSNEMYRIYGRHSKTFKPNYEKWIKAIHPEDRKEVERQMASLQSYRNEVRLKYRILRFNDEIRHVESRCILELKRNGTRSRCLGTTVDVTELRMHEQAFRSLANNFALMNGEEFFNKVSKYLTTTLRVDYAFVGEFLDGNRVKVIGGIAKGQIIGEMEYGIAGTPCENVLKQEVCTYNSGVQELFPEDQLLIDMEIAGYVGCPLVDKDGNSIGIIVLLNEKEITNSEIAASTLQIFSGRTSAELQRLESETKLADSEEKLAIINNHSPDYIYTVDRNLKITYLNKELYGIQPLNALSLYLKDIVPALCYDRFYVHLQKAFLGENQLFEIQMNENEIKPVWYSIRMSLIKDDSLSNRLLVVSTEITKRKKAEIRSAFIDAVSNKLNSPISVKDYCEFIFFELLKIKPFHNVYISTYDHSKNALSLFFQVKARKIKNETTPPRVNGNGLSEYIIRTKKGLILNGEELKTFQENLGLKVYGKLTKSWIGVPIMFDENVIGVLAAQCHRMEGAFNNDDLHLFSFIATQIGSFVEKVRVEEENNQFKKYFSISMDLLCIADINGRFKKINPKFCEILDYTEEELCSKSFLEFVHPEDVAATLSELEQLSKGKKTIDFINRYRCKNDDYKWFLWAAVADVKTNDVYAAAKDITEQIKTKDILTFLAKIQGEFISGSSIATSFRPIIEKIIAVTKSEVCYIIEIREKEFVRVVDFLDVSSISQSTLSNEHPDAFEYQDLQKILDDVMRKNAHVIADNLPFGLKENQVSEGKKGIKNVAAMPFYNRNEMMGIVVVANSPNGYTDKDVQLLSPLTVWCATFLKSVEDTKEKLEVEKKLSSLAEIVYNSNDAIISTDPEGIVLSWNSGAEKMFEYSAEEMLGTSVAKLGPKNLRTAHVDIMRKVTQGKSVQSYETVQLKKGNRLIYVNMSIFPLLDENGNVQRISSILRDVSEQKEIQKIKEEFTKELEKKVFERTVDLERAQMKLSISLAKEKELGELKSRFVSTASHQFRTPLSVIQASMAVLDIQKGVLEGKFKTSFDQVYERIKGQIKRMTNLMDEVLILSKIDSGNIKPKFQLTDLVSLCQEVVNNYNDIQQDSIKTSLSVLGEPVDLMLDAKLMEHAISNLVSNAIKYSHGPKGPSIKIHFKENDIEVLIIDSGIGIPEKDLRHLFEPFFRASNSGDFTGTGLGSSIAKDYIEMNGGLLSVSSEEHVGSEFKIVFTKKNLNATVTHY